MEEILLNIESKERRCARLKNGKVQDLVVERRKSRQLSGNIYRGKVINILQNIKSAFVNINEGENGFIHISDILENTKKFENSFDMDFETADPKKQQPKKKKKADDNIESHLKTDQTVLVQVVKEPIGSKGARLTSNISLPGRYLVLLPNSSHRGVSRRIEDRATRERLKRIIRSFEMPSDMGLICRTASRLAEPEQLIQEATELLAIWNQVVEKFADSKGPQLLHEESDIIRRSLVTAVDKRLDRVLVDDFPTYERCLRIYEPYANEHEMRIEYYRDNAPMFERFGVEREIEKALQRKVWLQSGGYLYFDHTEAMWTIDVNSGRSTAGSGGNLEEALVRINLEAAEEISRQLRIRNIGGLVICDFIDMRSRKNQRRVLTKLKDCMKEDAAKCTVLNMSEFGLVEMTRQRTREPLVHTMFTACPYCTGSGLIKTKESLSIEVERALKKAIHNKQEYAIRVVTHPMMHRHLLDHDHEFFSEMSENLNTVLEFDSDDELHLNDFRLCSSISNTLIEV